MTEKVISNSVLFYRKNTNRKPARNPIPLESIDYKNISLLSNYVSPKGRILAARISGTSRKEQKLLTKAIKKARLLGLLPFTTFI